MAASLTPALLKQIEPLQMHWWLDVGMSTEPADTAVAETGVREAYTSAGLTPPPLIQWVRSPREAWRFIASNAHDLGRPVSMAVLRRAHSRAVRGIVERISRAMFSEIVAQFRWPLFAEIEGVASRGLRGLPRERSLGCHGAEWCGVFEFCERELGIETAAPMRGILRVAEAAGWWWPFTEACVISDRPARLELDMECELHSLDGPALAFRDGTAFYAWHGKRVPKAFVTDANRPTLIEIERMRTIAVRRCAIERYGIERYLRDADAERVHADDYGTLYLKRFDRREPLMMVKVVNTTPEPDGTFKDYFLRVPPGMKTAQQAVAWTFGMEHAEWYAPTLET